MNFRTTLVLLVLVIAAGISVFVMNHKSETAGTADIAAGNEHKLIPVDSKDVTKLAITNVDGKRTVFQKTGADWQLVEPVKAGAKTFEVDGLINDLLGQQSRGQVDASQKSAGGLDHPSFTVELTGKNNAVTKLLVGDKPQMGDTLLVLLNDNKKPDVVGTALYTQLDKPASTYRKSQLVEVAQDQIKQLSVTRGKTTIRLEKNGNDWRMTEPKAMPADTSAVSDLLFGITGLNAAEFVTDDAAKADVYGLNRPKVSVWYSNAVPSTQPAATQAATTQPSTLVGGTTIRFGDYEDVLKKNVFAEVDSGPIAKVLTSSETTFVKTQLDLRDKNVLTLDPEKVQRITIQVNQPATTQPTTKPADVHEYAIERRKEAPAMIGPILPAGVATTGPATTQSTTQAATTMPAPAATQPASKWVFASGGQGDAEEGQVTDLLSALHPLHVEKYLEAAPTTQPASNITLAVVATDGTQTTIKITDPGTPGKPVGSYMDLAFELDRSLLDKLNGDFKTKKPEPVSSPTPSFGGAGGMPFGGQ